MILHMIAPTLNGKAALLSPLEALITPLGWLLRHKRADPRLSVRHADELASNARIDLSSPSFADGGTIPDRHSSGRRGHNMSPALQWSRLSEGTRQLLLVIEDIDSPARRPSVHTIALIDPDTPGLAEAALTPHSPRIRYVPNHRGRAGYVGPQPLPGHGTHHYGFHLYALDQCVDPTGINNLDQLLPHLTGHILAAGMMEGVQIG